MISFVAFGSPSPGSPFQGSAIPRALGFRFGFALGLNNVIYIFFAEVALRHSPEAKRP